MNEEELVEHIVDKQDRFNEVMFAGINTYEDGIENLSDLHNLYATKSAQEWQVGSYNEGSLVSYKDALYISIEDTDNPIDSSSWVELPTAISLRGDVFPAAFCNISFNVYEANITTTPENSFNIAGVTCLTLPKVLGWEASVDRYIKQCLLRIDFTNGANIHDNKYTVLLSATREDYENNNTEYVLIGSPVLFHKDDSGFIISCESFNAQTVSVIVIPNF